MVEGEAGTGIIRIVDEGSRVKSGEVIVELDSSRLRNESTQQRILVEQAESAEEQAAKNVAIQKTQNESDISAAQLKLDLARLDLEKYKEGDYIQEKSTIEGEITLAKEDLTRAEEKYEFTKRLSKKGYATQSELEADRIAVTKARIARDVADSKLNVLMTYTYKRQMAEMEANALEFARELERVRLKAAAALAQFESTLSAAKLTAEVERQKFQKLMTQIKACTIRAPRDGLVVYANTNTRRSQEPQIYEGAKVRERQALIHLPDTSKMQVDARVHESKIDSVREGLSTKIRVDARPGEVFYGVVDMVSLVPISGNWPNINLKEYVTTIAIHDEESRVMTLKPGLTAEVEILVERIESALQIPIQAVIERGGKHFAFVLTPQGVVRREVSVGKTNDIMIVIEDGLREKEKVILNPRTVLSKEIDALEAEFPQSREHGDRPRGPQSGPAAAPETKPSGKSAPAGAPGETARKGGPRGPGGDPAAFFKQMDANSDGKLSEAELPDRMKARFTSIDANQDKFIDQAEWEQAAAAFRAQGGANGGKTAEGDSPPRPQPAVRSVSTGGGAK